MTSSPVASTITNVRNPSCSCKSAVFIGSPELAPHDLRQMLRPPAGRLANLLPATEAVGDDERVGRRLAHGGQEHALADVDGYLVVLLVEAKCASHPAAAAIENSSVQMSGADSGRGRLAPGERLLMTVK